MSLQFQWEARLRVTFKSPTVDTTVNSNTGFTHLQQKICLHNSLSCCCQLASSEWERVKERHRVTFNRPQWIQQWIEIQGTLICNKIYVFTILYLASVKWGLESEKSPRERRYIWEIPRVKCHPEWIDQWNSLSEFSEHSGIYISIKIFTFKAFGT